MKFLAVLILFSLSQLALAADETSKPNGAGIFFGEPTGFTYKHWLTPETAFDAGIAFSFSDFVILYGDYLWHFPKLIQVRREDSKFLHQLTPYVGVGGVLFISDDDDRSHPKYYTQDGSTVALGVRVPIGVEWYPEPSPIRVYVEITPGVGIIPSTLVFSKGASERVITSDRQPVLTRGLTVLLAAAVGIAVANLYYAQPLVALIASYLKLSPGAAGLILTLTHIGYGVGVLFLVLIGGLGFRFQLAR